MYLLRSTRTWFISIAALIHCWECRGRLQAQQQLKIPSLSSLTQLKVVKESCCLMVCAAVLQVICTKVRDGDKRIVRLKEGEPRGRHVVIVDDLVQSGGTLRECQKLLSTQVIPHRLMHVPSRPRAYRKRHNGPSVLTSRFPAYYACCSC